MAIYFDNVTKNHSSGYKESEESDMAIYFDNMTKNHSSDYKESEENDTDDEIVNINKVTLKISNLFNDWESVQVIINLYVKQNGFVKSGTHQSKKVEDISLHRECTSYKTDCPWYALHVQDGWVGLVTASGGPRSRPNAVFL
ncbi:hypothetical protein C1645_834152 [Glomus cerebriforme]|uniref:Uncharacterized protein n=1 Tax=Glomus cerebriforme TaxID=658196 RepID=A0A397SA38_9GLOM|nr:hypothetical protein C1645_834152 [Glomus cerebriforme]